MHEIMQLLRLQLEELMLKAVRQSFFTQNDETRILVHSRENMNAPFKYNVEYIHAELSQEVKLLVMKNIAFMYSLLESCKQNSVNFGEYIEDILTRLLKGEKADASFLPNNYVPRPKEEVNKVA